MVEPIEFVSRATVEECTIYRRRMWRSRCGRYRVSEFVSRLEARKVYWAERRESDSPGWSVISRHTKRSTAVAAVQRENRRRGSR